MEWKPVQIIQFYTFVQLTTYDFMYPSNIFIHMNRKSLLNLSTATFSSSDVLGVSKVESSLYKYKLVYMYMYMFLEMWM